MKDKKANAPELSDEQKAAQRRRNEYIDALKKCELRSGAKHSLVTIHIDPMGNDNLIEGTISVKGKNVSAYWNLAGICLSIDGKPSENIGNDLVVKEKL